MIAEDSVRFAHSGPSPCPCPWVDMPPQSLLSTLLEHGYTKRSGAEKWNRTSWDTVCGEKVRREGRKEGSEGGPEGGSEGGSRGRVRKEVRKEVRRESALGLSIWSLLEGTALSPPSSRWAKRGEPHLTTPSSVQPRFPSCIASGFGHSDTS